MTTYDAVIIGARAAGAPTAMLLARKGYSVALIDRDDFPSDTISTHILHVQGLAAMQRWGILDSFTAGDTPKIRNFPFDLGDFTINGRVPEYQGLDYLIAPRRYLLDKHLVDNAVAAGAQLFTGINIRELVESEDGSVTGVTGYDRDGIPCQFNAKVVIGADGMNSRIARLVDAREYRNEPALTATYYSYWTDIDVETRFYIRDRALIGVYPTSEGQTIIFVQMPREDMDSFKKDIEGNFFRQLSKVDGLAEAVSGGTRIERFAGSGDVRNFFRTPYGNGWALVGDAGYHRDPTLGHGIMDAFFQADLLAEALDDVFAGRTGWDTAMAVFQQQRDYHHSADYDFIVSASHLEAEPTEQEIALLEALSRDQVGADQYASMCCGILSPVDFFAEANIAAIFTRLASQSLAAAA